MKNWLKFKLRDGFTMDRTVFWGIMLAVFFCLLVVLYFFAKAESLPPMRVYHAGVPSTMTLDVEPASGENMDARGMLPECPDARENRWLQEAQDQDNSSGSSGNDRDGGTIDKDH